MLPGPRLALRVAALALGEQPPGERGPPLERPLEAVDPQQIQSDAGHAVSVPATGAVTAQGAAPAQDQPGPAVLDDVLAADPADAVAGVVVERPAAVGRLAPAARPADRAEQPRAHAAPARGRPAVYATGQAAAQAPKQRLRFRGSLVNAYSARPLPSNRTVP